METFLTQKIPKKYLSKWVAYTVILSIITSNQNIEKILNNSLDFQNLNKKDRAYCYHLIFTFFRFARLYLPLVNQYLEKKIKFPLSKIDILLLFSIVQLQIVKTDDYAVIDAAVSFASASGQKAKAKFVNAVLRKLALHGEYTYNKLHYFPRWLREKMEKQYGQSKVKSIVDTYLKQPEIDLFLANKNLSLSSTKPLYGNIARLTESISIENLEGYEDGGFWVQSVMAATSMSLLGDINQKRAYDLCAAPGGKTMWLCHHGANVTAIEKKPERIDRLHENLGRMKMKAEIICEDALLWSPSEKADIVIVDVPCSGTGVLHHHPESLWTRDKKDLNNLIQEQEKLIKKAAQIVKQNGTILYCTCSILHEEGVHQINHFLKNNRDFICDKILAEEVEPFKHMITKEGYMQSTPDGKPEWGSITGFFVARLKKLPIDKT